MNYTSIRLLHTFVRVPLLFFLLWLVLLVIILGPSCSEDGPKVLLYQVHAFSISHTRSYSSITTNNHRRILRQEYHGSTSTLNPRASFLLFLQKDDFSSINDNQNHTTTTSSSRTTDDATTSADDKGTSSSPPFTTVMKQRRIQEIQLLKELEYSDDAIPSLWKLWSMEKGTSNAVLLLQAEQYMSTGEFELAQQLLQSLIQTHGMHWAEPMNKLATLYYMMGQFQKSKELCLLVLQVKPWHFGALSGIVLVCTVMKDVTGARVWADRRLPPLVPIHTSGDRRSQWVQRAVQDAKESLDRAIVENTWNIGAFSWNEMEDVERNSSWQ